MNDYKPYPYAYAKGVYQATLSSLDMHHIPGVVVINPKKFGEFLSKLEKENEAIIQKFQNLGTATITSNT